MADNLSFVTCTIRRGGTLYFDRFWLVQTNDGKYWAYPEDANLSEGPESVHAYPLEPSGLKKLDEPNSEHDVYEYREVLVHYD